MVLVVCRCYRMLFDANGCVSPLVNVDWIKWMFFCVNDFKVVVNDSTFSDNEHKSCIIADHLWDRECWSFLETQPHVEETWGMVSKRFHIYLPLVETFGDELAWWLPSLIIRNLIHSNWYHSIDTNRTKGLHKKTPIPGPSTPSVSRPHDNNDEN